MSRIWMKGTSKGVLGMGLAVLLGSFAAQAAPNLGHPGIVNYVEGQVSVDGRQLTQRDVGSADIEQGQVLETGQGKAEVLLTPGVFLRVGNGSQIRMDNPGLTNTRVAVLKGQAMLEVTELFKQNNIQVGEDGATTTVEKRGLYEFDANRQLVAVEDGKAVVTEGDQHVNLKKGKETYLAQLHAQSFDTKQHDDLYNWSNLRSEYLAEAEVQSARTYLVGGGWVGPGWYWNPWWGMYSFVPGAGILYSPFGWGFYSPALVYAAPVYRAGFVGRAAVVAPAVRAPAAPLARGFSSGFRGGFAGGRR
jgi:hypothetical protein